MLPSYTNGCTRAGISSCLKKNDLLADGVATRAAMSSHGQPHLPPSSKCPPRAAKRRWHLTFILPMLLSMNDFGKRRAVRRRRPAVPKRVCAERRWAAACANTVRQGCHPQAQSTTCWTTCLFSGGDGCLVGGNAPPKPKKKHHRQTPRPPTQQKSLSRLKSIILALVESNTCRAGGDHRTSPRPLFNIEEVVFVFFLFFLLGSDPKAILNMRVREHLQCAGAFDD